MPKRRVVSVPRTPGQWQLDPVSHGRRGPGGVEVLSPAQIEQVARTVRKAPEVMVKVSGGARESDGAKAHFSYIDRHGKLEILTDDDRALEGKNAAAELVADWNLDLCKGQYRPKPPEGQKDNRPKLVHNIVLSMPGGTPPQAVLAAARKLARENFALQYRYAMVLHTDQRNPHVHLVVKAEHEYEPGKRLYIRKATLQDWREQFASYLRAEGVAANATPKPVRGQARTDKKSPIHQRLKDLREYEALPAEQKARRSPPADSHFMRNKVQGIADEIKAGRLQAEPVKERLIATRRQVIEDWVRMAGTLRAQGQDGLANEVERFVDGLPPVRTEKESIAAGLLAQIAAQREQRAGVSPAGKSRGS